VTNTTQASPVIGGLEESVEKAEDGTGRSRAGQSWNNSHAFLQLPRQSTEDILSLMEVFTVCVIDDETNCRIMIGIRQKVHVRWVPLSPRHGSSSGSGGRDGLQLEVSCKYIE
jgi:hypothetical protein